MLVSKGWKHQVLKMSLSTDLLPDPISNRCWNSQLLEAVLECRGLGPLPSNSSPPLGITVTWWEGWRGGQEQGTSVPCDD